MHTHQSALTCSGLCVGFSFYDYFALACSSAWELELFNPLNEHLGSPWILPNPIVIIQWLGSYETRRSQIKERKLLACTKSSGIHREDTWFKPSGQHKESKAATTEGPSAAYQTLTAWRHKMEQPGLLEASQNPTRTFHNLCHEPSGPYHLPTLSQSKWITLLPNSDLLFQASREGLRNHMLSLRHDKGNIFKVTGVFTYTSKEKDLQHVHLILSSSRHIWKKIQDLDL